MGEAVVHGGEGVQLGLDVDLILRVQVHFKSLGAINLVANSLSDNLSGVHDILEDLLVHVGESARTRAGSLLDGGAVEGLGENISLGDNDNMATTNIDKIYQYKS